MADERRIGAELKGLSNSLLEEIENGMWEILLIEIELFEQEKILQEAKGQFIKDMDRALSQPQAPTHS